VFDSVFELMNKLPHLSDGDPDGDIRSSVGYAISRSSSDNLGFVNRYSGLEVLAREARVGIGFGSWREWGRHQLGVTYRSVHYNNRENSDILCSTEQPSASSGLWSGTKDYSQYLTVGLEIPLTFKHLMIVLRSHTSLVYNTRNMKTTGFRLDCFCYLPY
jgi:hypothetical protein